MVRRSFSQVIAGFLLAIALSGCHVYQVCESPTPPVPIPDAYSESGYEEEGNCQPWWEFFDDPQLNHLVEQALTCNLEISQAWSRLREARAFSCIQRSFYWPELTADSSFTYTRAIDRGSDRPFSFSAEFNRWALIPRLTYEVDLWRRIDSQVSSAYFAEEAACDDVLATALLISGAVTNLWLQIQQQKALEQLLHHQIEVGRTLLHLVEIRFAFGRASALDVYQQEQQLKSTELLLPPTLSLLEQSLQELSILLGCPPTLDLDAISKLGLPDLPVHPNLGTPCDLLEQRPDIRRAMNQLVSTDYDVAVAVAEQFPRFDLNFSYEFAASDIRSFFDSEVATIMANILTPLFDASRRRCEVERRKAIADEQLDRFGAVFLEALGEVEGALTFEKYQVELLEELAEQLRISRLNMREARARYAAGLSDYLPVIAAIQALQEVERRMITEKKNLLANRSELYLALGGPILLGDEEEEECL